MRRTDLLANVDRRVDRPVIIDWEHARGRRMNFSMDDYSAPALSGAFDPTSVAGKVAIFDAAGLLWQDSSRTTPATLDADPIGAWDDVSGLAHHLLQATAGNRPALKLAVQHGLPAIRSTGVSVFLQTGAYTQAQPLTLVCAIKPTWANGKYLWDGQDNPDRAAAFWEATNNGNLDIYAGSIAATGVVAGSWSTLNIVYNGASSLVRVNGGADAAVSLGTNGQNGLTLFSRQTGASLVAMDVGRIGVWAGALSLPNRALLDGWTGAYL